MKKAINEPLIDVKTLEWELRDEGYPEREIEDILDEANYINSNKQHTAEKLNDFYFKMKEKVL